MSQVTNIQIAQCKLLAKASLRDFRQILTMGVLPEEERELLMRHIALMEELQKLLNKEGLCRDSQKNL